MTKIINPFSVYIIAFISAIGLYVFKFSKLYPNLGLELIIFLIISFFIAGCLSKKIRKSKKLNYSSVSSNNKVGYSILILYVFYILDFIYAKQIPLFSKSNNYLEFKGIPTIHVLIYTFNIFIAIYVFHLILSEKGIKNKILFLITLVPAILLVSRGMLMNILIGSFFVFVLKIGDNIAFYKKNGCKIIVVLLIGMFLFGVFGNIRNNSINGDDIFSNKYILMAGDASDSFKNSIIPKEFFWGYIYISSPLANLQLNIYNKKPTITIDNFKKFIANELTMDFISKRIFKNDYKSKREILLIAPHLTVGTFYSGAFFYLGWGGMIIIFLFLMLICYIYINILSENNPFRIVGIAMLCNLIALCAFSNMITFSGMTFQLFYPILFEIYNRIKQYKEVNNIVYFKRRE